MSFTKRAYNTAKKMIDKYGDTVTLVDKTQVVYNPDTGMYDSIEQNSDTKGVISNFDTADVIPGTVNIDDISILLYAPYVTPEYDFFYHGERYRIINVLQRISVQDNPVIYKIQGRK